MVSLLSTKFHEILFSSFRGVALTNCMTDRQTDNMSPHQRKKNMKWFDKDLKQLRFNLINYGKIYIKFPKDPVVKNHFNKLYREYNKQRKYKCKSYKENTL